MPCEASLATSSYTIATPSNSGSISRIIANCCSKESALLADAGTALSIVKTS